MSLPVTLYLKSVFSMTLHMHLVLMLWAWCSSVCL